MQRQENRSCGGLLYNGRGCGEWTRPAVSASHKQVQLRGVAPSGLRQRRYWRGHSGRGHSRSTSDRYCEGKHRPGSWGWREPFWACLPEPCVPAAEGKIAKHAKGEVVASFQNEAQLRKDPRGQEFGAE